MENVESMDNQKETAAVPFLPIGSVVLLKNGKKRVMVYGRKVNVILQAICNFSLYH